MKNLLDVCWLEAQVRQILGHPPVSAQECLEGFRKLFQGQTRQAFYALAWQKAKGERVELPQPPHTPPSLVVQAFQLALDKTATHLRDTQLPALQPPPLEAPTLWAQRIEGKLGHEPRSLDEVRTGLEQVLAEGGHPLEAHAWSKLARGRVALPKPRDPVEQWVVRALLEHLDKLATQLQTHYPSQVQALRRVVEPTTQKPEAARPQRPLRYLKFGGSQVPVYPKDLLPRPLEPVFQTPIHELKLGSGRVLRQKGRPVFQGWRGDKRWWNAPDARPAEAVEFLQGLLASRELIFEDNQLIESAHFPQEETPTLPTRWYALYRDPRTHQDWFRAEAFAW